MKSLSLILCALLAAGGLPGGHTRAAFSEAAPRVAVLGFNRPSPAPSSGARELERALTEALAADARLRLIDRAVFEPALRAIGDQGSINMSLEEARGIGMAVGCDFYIIGKCEAVARSTRAGDAHQEALAGVMIVDGRRGRLAHFDFITKQAASAEAAIAAAVRTLSARAAGYAERMLAYRRERETLPHPNGPSAGAPDDVVEEIPEENSPRAAGFTPPVFLNRVKPEYSEMAGRADVSATVEARAVFRRDGEVGEVEIVRWAGFGLDENAERAIRQLKFKPATRDGRPISVRALIRYNFRRVEEKAEGGG